MEDKTAKPMVVFFDCCISRTPLERMLKRYLPFLEYVFAMEAFSEEICRNDFMLFSEIENLRKKKHKNQVCLVITCDGDFIDQVKKHAAFQKTLPVIKVSSSGSFLENYLQAEQIVRHLLDRYKKVVLDLVSASGPVS